ncbi:MAG: hypothetical protein ACTSU5_00700 [Promethearchaeota archaeon]
MHEITRKLDELSPREISEALKILIDRWRPLVETNYGLMLSSLAEHIVDKFGT